MPLPPMRNSEAMARLQADVAEAHVLYEHPVLDTPTIPAPDRVKLRMAMLEEEQEELRVAVAANDIVEIADAIADNIWLQVGMALEFGIPLDRVWEEVRRSNLEKKDPVTGKLIRRADGKVLKPAGWVPPDIKKALGITE